jgi:hypothetical protein
MLINLTPHPIVIFPADHPILEGEGWIEATDKWIISWCKIIPKSTEYPPARLVEIELGSYKIDEINIERIEYGHLSSTPPQVTGTYYIVSLATALAVGRLDFLVPYLEVRNKSGTVIGCRSLARPC